MKRKIIFIVIFSIFLSGSFGWGKKSSSSAPATVSAATAKAEKKAQSAKKSAENAKKHADTVKANLESAKADSEVKKAIVESSKAKQAAAEAKKAAATAALKAAAAGTEAAKKAQALAEAAAKEAEDAALEAMIAAREADLALDIYKKSKSSYSEAFASAEEMEALYEEAAALLEAAIRADEEFTKAWEEYNNAKKQVEDSINKLEEDREEKNENEYNSIIQDFLDKEKKSFEAYDKAELAADATILAYAKLGDFYQQKGLMGDPVAVGSGDFQVEYTDFIAEDYLDKFFVSRNYSSIGYKESFGKNWSCSLDSRIIRCNFKDWEEKKKLIQECLNLSVRMRTLFEDYNKNNPSFPRPETEEYFTYADNLKKLMEGELKEVQKIINLRNFLAEKNKYCSYGRFSNPESYYGYSKQMIFLDENGNPCYYNYEGNGLWHSAGVISKYDKEIYCLDENGMRSGNDNFEGGYEVCYENGNRSYYDKYGILTKKIDRNGNEEIYLNKDGLIYEIILKTGEHIYIERNTNNYITKIKGNVSGEALYFYNGDYLSKIIDDKNMVMEYEYSNNLLVGIKKPENKNIEIKYEYNAIKNKYVCCEVNNEDGISEYFMYDYQNRTVLHKNYSGKIESFKLNEYDNPVYVCDYFKNETFLETGSNSIITSVTTNSNKKKFLYDELWHPVKVEYSNGSSIKLSYTKIGCGNYLESITDPDGFCTQYLYDLKGNLIGEKINDTILCQYTYYPTGLIKSIEKESSKIEYEYNQFGSILKKTEIERSGHSFSQHMTYDDKNRIIRIVDTNGKTVDYSYSNEKIIKNSGEVNLEFIFDKRNRLIKEILSDKITDKVVTKEYVYDGFGNITKIFINGELYKEFAYSDDFIIATSIFEIDCALDDICRQSIKESFLYDEYGKLYQIEKKAVTTEKKGKELLISRSSSSDFTYFNQSDLNIVKIKNNIGLTYVNTYDFAGRLIKEEKPGGYVRKRSYTKAGRISSVNDSNFMLWDYKYKSDGSWDIFVYSKSMPIRKESYDNKGKLLYQDDVIYGKSYFSYAGDKLVEEKTTSYVQNCEYDDYGRKCKYSMMQYDSPFSKGIGKLLFSYVIKYVDSENKVFVCSTENGDCFLEYKLDGTGHPIESIDKNGTWFYEYDSLNRLCKKIDGNKNEYIFYYDANDKIDCIIYPDKQKRFIFHDVDGTINSIIENDRYIKQSIYNRDERKFDYINSFGNKTSFWYDENGYITGENILNSGKYDYSTLKETYEKNKKNDDSIIVRNTLGNIISISNSNSNIMYEYDSLSRLISSIDLKSGIKIEYSYDRFGRCVSENIDGTDICYEYDSCGNIKNVYDCNSDFMIQFEYDCFGREIKRNYWTGVLENYSYNELGLIESKVIRDKYNQILNANFLFYDEKGRLTYLFDGKGTYEHYEYNDLGQVSCVESPYEPSIIAFKKEEAMDFGLPLDVQPKVFISYLNDDIIEKLNRIISKNNLSNQIIHNSYQKNWKEEFSYTNNGSVKSVTNNLGKILYDYDRDNKLISVCYDGFSSNKMNLIWNNKGCLLEVEGCKTLLTLNYGDNLRINAIEYIDKNTLSSCNIEYSYDGLGRRYEETLNDGTCFISLYDGVSSSLLQKSLVYRSGSKNTFHYSPESNLYSEDDNKYRYLNDNSYTPYGEEKYLANNDAAEYYTIFNAKPLKNILVNGNIVAVNSRNLWQEKLCDYRKRAIFDLDEYDTTVREFDIFGSDYSKSYNLINCLHNAGNRDYISTLKTFTSSDPQYDGVNWYAYCAGDSVNYVDLDGNKIVTVPQTYLMTDSVYQNMRVGKSTNKEDSINKVGCYVTCYANAVCELYGRGVMDADKIRYTSVIGVNNDKTIFSGIDKASLIRDKSMNQIFNSSNDYANVSWDYFTRDISGELRIKIELAKAAALKDDYVIMGVFDLSDLFKNITNHMVIIDEMFDVNGIFNELTYSSKNDAFRQDKNPDAYSVDNLKELRLVKIESKNCSK